MPEHNLSFDFNSSQIAYEVSSSEIVEGIGFYFIFIPSLLILVCTVIGNLLVIAAVLFEKKLNRSENFYILSLAIVDLTVGLFVLPLSIYQNIHRGNFYLGPLLCKIYVTADVTLCTSSIFNLCIIAWDRYKSICDPIKHIQRRNKKFVSYLIVANWFFSFLISSPPLFGWNDWHEMKADECRLVEIPQFVIYSAFGSFYIPMIIVTGFYYKIFKAIRIRLKNRAKLGIIETSTETGNDLIKRNESKRENRSHSVETIEHARRMKKISLSRERRASKTLGIIIGAIIICWLPFSVIYIIPAFDDIEFDRIVVMCLTWLGYLNSLLNPIIYTVFNSEFRKAFKKILGFESYYLRRSQ